MYFLKILYPYEQNLSIKINFHHWSSELVLNQTANSASNGRLGRTTQLLNLKTKLCSYGQTLSEECTTNFVEACLSLASPSATCERGILVGCHLILRFLIHQKLCLPVTVTLSPLLREAICSLVSLVSSIVEGQGKHTGLAPGFA